MKHDRRFARSLWASTLKIAIDLFYSRADFSNDPFQVQLQLIDRWRISFFIGSLCSLYSTCILYDGIIISIPRGSQFYWLTFYCITIILNCKQWVTTKSILNYFWDFIFSWNFGPMFLTYLTPNCMLVTPTRPKVFVRMCFPRAFDSIPEAFSTASSSVHQVQLAPLCPQNCQRLLLLLILCLWFTRLFYILRV